VDLALPISLHASSIPIGTRFGLTVGKCVFSTNCLISATSPIKCATAFGKLLKEISFLSIIIDFDDYGANEMSDLTVINDTYKNTKKNTGSSENSDCL
jgi:hypothetical protein